MYFLFIYIYHFILFFYSFFLIIIDHTILVTLLMKSLSRLRAFE